MSMFLLQCCPDTVLIMKCSCKLVAATNGSDENIVYSICGAIIWVTGIIVCGALIWRLLDHIAKRCQEKRKNKKDVEDCRRKQKASLIDKLLDFKKEQAHPYEKDKEGKPQEKVFNVQKSEEYEAVISFFLSLVDSSNQSIDLENLKKAIGKKTDKSNQSGADYTSISPTTTTTP